MDYLQWPAMLVTVVAVWLVGDQSKSDRRLGFWIFLLSNVLWVVWGLHAKAYALVILQFALAILNCRGIRRNKLWHVKLSMAEKRYEGDKVVE
jgi:hypothetical protein